METIDPQTGEVTEKALTVYSPDTFVNITAKPVADDQAAVLLAEIDPDDLDILPTGEVYLTQAKYRQRLNKAFKPGGWAMRPLGSPYIKDGLAMQEWALYANGQFLAYAVGGAEYRESNQRMNWSDVLETLKSNALMRLCKDLGVASECWNKRFAETFKAQYCVKVFVEGQNRPQWRRYDGNPLYKERGIAPDSPNRDKYDQPTPTQPQSPKQPATVEQKQPAPPSPAPAKSVVAEQPKPANGKKVASDPMTQFWAAVREANLSNPEGQRILSSVGGDAVKAIDALQGISQPTAN